MQSEFYDVVKCNIERYLATNIHPLNLTATVDSAGEYFPLYAALINGCQPGIIIVQYCKLLEANNFGNLQANSVNKYQNDI
jgi:hypothetical protein